MSAFKPPQDYATVVQISSLPLLRRPILWRLINCLSPHVKSASSFPSISGKCDPCTSQAFIFISSSPHCQRNLPHVSGSRLCPGVGKLRREPSAGLYSPLGVLLVTACAQCHQAAIAQTFAVSPLIDLRPSKQPSLKHSSPTLELLGSLIRASQTRTPKYYGNSPVSVIQASYIMELILL